MGLFGFGKKKQTESETDKVFREFGSETNDVKTPERQSRKDAIEAATIMRTSSIKKDQLLEKLGFLRKNMYNNPDFTDYLNELEDSISKLKRMGDNVNKAAMSSVDNFLLGAINDAINYCNRGNYIAMGACIDIVDELVNDRFQCGNYYTDPKFCKFKLQRNQLYVEQQNQQSAYDKLALRMEQLKRDSQNPNLRVSKESIAREAMRIKQEGQRIKARLDNIESQIQILDKSISEIITHDITHGNDNKFNITDELDSIMEIKRENEADASFTDKVNDKLDESHRRVTANSLGVKDGTMESNTPIELNDDLFNM